MHNGSYKCRYKMYIWWFIWCRHLVIFIYGAYVAGLQHLSDSVPDLPLLKRQDQERPGSRMPDDEEDEREDEQWLRRRPPNHEQRLSCEFYLVCSDISVVLWISWQQKLVIQNNCSSWSHKICATERRVITCFTEVNNNDEIHQSNLSLKHLFHVLCHFCQLSLYT